MPHGRQNQKIKQKQYCNKFKNGPHQKKILKIFDLFDILHYMGNIVQKEMMLNLPMVIFVWVKIITMYISEIV